jgi:hypothetical protein
MIGSEALGGYGGGERRAKQVAESTYSQQIHHLDISQNSHPSSTHRSEYTTYKLALDAYGVWDTLHERFDDVQVTCWNVWWEGDLPWKAEEVFKQQKVCEEEREGGRDSKRCLFSVVQSTSGVRWEEIEKQMVDLGVL